MFFYIWFFPLFLMFFGLFVIVFAIINQVHKNSSNNINEELNDKVANLLKEKKFEISKKIFINDNFSFQETNDKKKQVLIDEENKKILLTNYEDGKSIIVEFKDIVNYEIYENGGTQTTGLGAGGFFGGVFTASSSKTSKDLKLIIRLDSISNPLITYTIIDKTLLNFGVNKSTQVYKICISSLQEIVSFLEVLKSKNNNISKN